MGKKKVKKVIFNVKLAIDYNFVNFGVFTNDKRGIYFSLTINGNDGKKNFDGSYTYTIDVSKKILMIMLKYKDGGILNILLLDI